MTLLSMRLENCFTHYCIKKVTHDADDSKKEEVDRKDANITKLLNEKSFSFTSMRFQNSHRHSFKSVYKHANEICPFKKNGVSKNIRLCIVIQQIFM